MLRSIRRLLVSLVFLFGLLCLLIAGFSTLQPVFETAKFAPANMIVVLGAGMDNDGTLHASSRLRVEKAVRLYLVGSAKRIHFSGGRGHPDGPAAGAQMAKMAQGLGVDISAISHEDFSQSTLQNALYSLPIMGDVGRIILVTEGFHLPRSWASFKWAAWNEGRKIEIALAHSTNFRPASPGRPGPVMMTIREAIAWPFNIGRAVLWQAGPLFGIADNERNAWLH